MSECLAHLAGEAYLILHALFACLLRKVYGLCCLLFVHLCTKLGLGDDLCFHSTFLSNAPCAQGGLV